MYLCTFVLARYLETTNACALFSLQNFIVKMTWRTYGRLFSCTSLAISHYQFIILRLFVSSVVGLKAFFHSQVPRFFKKFTFWRSSIYAHTSSPSFAYPGFRVRLNVFFSVSSRTFTYRLRRGTCSRLYCCAFAFSV